MYKGERALSNTDEKKSKNVILIIFAIIGVISTLGILLFVGYMLGSKGAFSVPAVVESVPAPTVTTTSIPTEVPETTPTSVPTEVPVPTLTSTPTPEPTPTNTPVLTNTPKPTNAPTSIPEPTEAPTSAPSGTTPRWTYETLYQTMYAIDTVKMRIGPSTDFEEAGNLQKGEQVTTITRCNETGWYGIIINGNLAFVSDKYLSETPPAQEPNISVSESSLIFTDSNPQTIMIYCESETPYSVQLEYVNHKGLILAEFGEFNEDSSLPVTITPVFSGKATIKLNLIDQNSKKVLDSVVVQSTVNADSLVEFPSIGTESLSVSQDKITFTDFEPMKIYVYSGEGTQFNCSDSDILKVEWNIINGVAELNILPKECGKTTLTISLLDGYYYTAIDIDVDVNAEIKGLSSSKTVVLQDAYIGSTVVYGTYEQDDNEQNGEEDLEWIVLDVQDGKALLLSKYSLHSKVWSRELYKKCEDGTILSGLVPYDDSTEFYDKAFSQTEKMRIFPTCLENGEFHYVFLLSKEKVEIYFNDNFLKSEYKDSISKRGTTLTKTADAEKMDWINNFFEDAINCGWLLRNTDGRESEYYVSGGGVICEIEMKLQLSNSSIVIGGDDDYTDYILNYRPAMWINLE